MAVPDCGCTGPLRAPAGLPAGVGLHLQRDARGSAGRVRSGHRHSASRLLQVQCAIN